MKFKKNMETKLRHYSTTIQSTHCESSSSTATNSVTEKLAKLRTEQARAATNRRQRQSQGGSSSDEQQHTTSHIHSWPGFFLSMDDQQADLQPQAHTSRLAAGPPPPPSWTRRRQNHNPTTTPPSNHFTLQHYRTQQGKLTGTTVSTIPSLVRLCCLQLATVHATAWSKPSRWIDLIKQSPNHIKQRILFEWAFDDDDDNSGCQRLVTNATMDIFEKTEYEELWLEASQVSLERLVLAFWKVIKVSSVDEQKNIDNELVDDWEDLLWKDDVDTTMLKNNNTMTAMTDDPPTIVLHLDYQEEIGKWKHLSHVMTVLLQRQLLESTATSPSYALSSPFLGGTLVSLNISFMRPAPSSAAPLCWTSFAHLVVSTLPHLRWLYSAGCFDHQPQGLEILTVLSRGLRKLKFWDLGCHSWLQLDSLISAIDWERDLLELTTLCLSGSNHTFSDITTWLKNHHLARIKLIWMDA